MYVNRVLRGAKFVTPQKNYSAAKSRMNYKGPVKFLAHRTPQNFQNNIPRDNYITISNINCSISLY